MAAMSRVPGMTGPWPKRRKLSMIVVETPYVCMDCGQVWTHHEVMPETDEPYGLPEDMDVVCDCGGRLAPVPEVPSEVS